MKFKIKKKQFPNWFKFTISVIDIVDCRVKNTKNKQK